MVSSTDALKFSVRSIGLFMSLPLKTSSAQSEIQTGGFFEITVAYPQFLNLFGEY